SCWHPPTRKGSLTQLNRAAQEQQEAGTDGTSQATPRPRGERASLKGLSPSNANRPRHDQSSFGYLIIILFIDTCGRRAVIASNTGVLSVLLRLHAVLHAAEAAGRLALLLPRSCGSLRLHGDLHLHERGLPDHTSRIALSAWASAARASRIGALLSPFCCSGDAADYSVMAAMLTYAGMAVVTTVCVLLMAVRHEGRSLMQTVEEVAEAASAGQPSSKPAGEPTEGDGLRMTGDPKEVQQRD
uniref:Transmembrane protein n=1 Tax=Macrostomum lignano TaxID=282301 RepID=A0A1I8FGD9_9PLAT